MSTPQSTEPLSKKIEITGSSIKRQCGNRFARASRQAVWKSQKLGDHCRQLLNTERQYWFYSRGASIRGKPGSSGLSGTKLAWSWGIIHLVLLNGRRLAAFAFGGEGTDLNSIPLSAIERVEVLKRRCICGIWCRCGWRVSSTSSHVKIFLALKQHRWHADSKKAVAATKQ